MGIVGGDFAIVFMGSEAFSGFTNGEIWKRRKSRKEKGRGNYHKSSVYCQFCGLHHFGKKWSLKLSYVTEFCNQTKVFEFLSNSGVWVMSYGFWVWVMSFEYSVLKTDWWLIQTSSKHLQKSLYLLYLFTFQYTQHQWIYIFSYLIKII